MWRIGTLFDLSELSYQPLIILTKNVIKQIGQYYNLAKSLHQSEAPSVNINSNMQNIYKT